MENFFNGKVAVVTGAGGTLCSEIAKFLGSRGAKVALIGRTEAKLQPVAEAICAMGGTALVIAADVNDEASMEAAGKQVQEQLGYCNMLINGAGGNQPKAMTTNEAFTAEDIELINRTYIHFLFFLLDSVEVGYPNLYNYSRWFKSITGASPLRWKKIN